MNTPITTVMGEAPMQQFEYAFDITLTAAVRVMASDEADARAQLADKFDCADANFGAWRTGAPILGEVSLVGLPSLYEYNQEPFVGQIGTSEAFTALRNIIKDAINYDALRNQKELVPDAEAYEVLMQAFTRMQSLIKQADTPSATPI